MWTPQECDNSDSCAEGQRHFYPDPGDTIEVREETHGRAVGSGREIKISAGSYQVGEHIDYQAHLVSVVYKDHLVWIGDDEAHPIGPEAFANIQIGRV